MIYLRHTLAVFKICNITKFYQIAKGIDDCGLQNSFRGGKFIITPLHHQIDLLYTFRAEVINFSAIHQDIHIDTEILFRETICRKFLFFGDNKNFRIAGFKGWNGSHLCTLYLLANSTKKCHCASGYGIDILSRDIDFHRPTGPQPLFKNSGLYTDAEDPRY